MVPARIVPTSFMHRDRLQTAGGELRLGKAYLVSRLQALLQTQRLHLPAARESEALAQELRDYEIHVSENANDTYGAFRVGSHHDLVTTLGLAVLIDPPLFMAAPRAPRRAAGLAWVRAETAMRDPSGWR
jgi:hypothetical protein